MEKPTAAIAIYQQPGSNSLDVSKGVKAKMEELAESFPSGAAYNVTLDTTDVIHASIDEVMVTFFETTLLVILVIFLFLQNWRAVIIPLYYYPGIVDRYICRNGGIWFLYQHINIVRTDFSSCYCGG